MSLEIPLDTSHVISVEDDRHGRFPNPKQTLEELIASGTARPEIAETLNEVIDMQRLGLDSVKELRHRGRWLLGNFSAYGRPDDEAHVGLLYAAVDPAQYKDTPLGTPVPAVEIATWVNENRAQEIGASTEYVNSSLLNTALDRTQKEDDRWYSLSVPVDRETEVHDLNSSTGYKYTVGYREDMRTVNSLPEGMPYALRGLLQDTVVNWHQDHRTGLFTPEQ